VLHHFFMHAEHAFDEAVDEAEHDTGHVTDG
jgi:hypothetical protein